MARLLGWRADAACRQPSLRDAVVRAIPHRFERSDADAIADASDWYLGCMADQYAEEPLVLHRSIVCADPDIPVKMGAAYVMEKKLLAIRHPERRHAEPWRESEAVQQLILSLAGGTPEEAARASHVVELGVDEFAVVLVVEALPRDVRGRLYERLCAVEMMQAMELSTATPGSPPSSPESSPRRVVEHRVQWVQCDACAKWRRIPPQLEELYANEPLDDGDKWYCSYLQSTTGLTCQTPEEAMDRDERVLA